MNAQALAELTVFSERWKPYILRFKKNTRPNLRSIGFFTAYMREHNIDEDTQTAFNEQAIDAVEHAQEIVDQATNEVIQLFNAHNQRNPGNVVPYIEPGPTSAETLKAFLPNTHRCSIINVDIIWNEPLVWKLAQLLASSQHLYAVTFYGKRLFQHGERVYRNDEPHTKVLSSEQFRHYNALPFRECARALGIIADLAYAIDPNGSGFVPRSEPKSATASVDNHATIL